MLRVIISPAKKMLAGVDGIAARDVPALTGRAARLLEVLAGMGAPDLQRLWRVSDRLLPACLEALDGLRIHGLPRSGADLADPAFSARVSPAVLAYAGIQYQSMAPAVMDGPSLDWIGAHLRILSGFYGCVRPFDAVLPYRLEMGAALPVDGARDLYGFWGDAIAREVCAGADGPDGGAGAGCQGAGCQGASGPDGGAAGHVVNLASVEYAKAVTPWLAGLGAQITTCIFGESLRDGRPVQRSTASKTARGSMVRWMAERGVEDARELTRFDVGYAFAPELSDEGAGRLVFMRA